MNAVMRLRMAASGSRPRPAFRLSIMYSTLSVPGITALTALLASSFVARMKSGGCFGAKGIVLPYPSASRTRITACGLIRATG